MGRCSVVGPRCGFLMDQVEEGVLLSEIAQGQVLVLRALALLLSGAKFDKKDMSKDLSEMADYLVGRVSNE